MTLKLMVAAASLALAGFATSSSAATVGPYTPDTLIGSADQCQGSETLGVDCDFQGSSTSAEIAYLEGLLGVSAGSLILDDKFEGSRLAFSQDSGGNWYSDVSPDKPGWFVLKFGIGGTLVEDSHYFFTNIAELTKLVWTNSDVNGLMSNCSVTAPGEILGEGDCRLSHITTVIPLPAAGWLLLGGIGGLVAMRRKKAA